MPSPAPSTPVRARLSALLTFAALLVIFFSWAFVEPVLRAHPIGGRILAFLERPLGEFGNLSISLLFLIEVILFLILLGLLAGRTRVLVRSLLERRPQLEPGHRYAIERSSGYIVFVLGCIIGLQSAGINLSSLAVLGGALGLGIGLGFQESANNFLSGLILLFERPIKVGDRVEVGNLDGDVVRIGSRATWIRTNANIMVIVPNSEFVTKQVINWTATDRQVRFSLPVGVSYNANPVEVKEALLAVARLNREVLDAPAPDVLFKAFGDSSLDFELRVWTITQVRTPNILRSDLYFAIFEELSRRGIEIPFPQRDLHIRSADVPLKIEGQSPANGPSNPPDAPI